MIRIYKYGEVSNDEIFARAEVKVDVERAQAWIKTGAQPTETVKALLKKANVI